MSDVVVKGTRVVAGLVLASAGVLGAMNQWEGDVHTVYADKLAYGIPTVCAGHTDWSLRVGTPYTEAECKRINGMNAQKYGMALISCSGHAVDRRVFPNQNVFDAFTLFAINVGTSGACGSRAMRLLKTGDLEQACRAIANGPDGTPAWSYAGGKFVQGLYNRRRFERDWCLKPVGPAVPETEAMS